MQVPLMLLITICSPAMSMRVVTTDPSQFLPGLEGQAEVLNSDLSQYDEVTICVRFNTFQFNTHQEAYDYQGLLTLGAFWVLGTYTALPCDWDYEGCTVYKKSYIPGWIHGTALGYYEKSNFYPSWQPGRWYSFCFIGSSLVNQSSVFVNGEKMLTIKNYLADHKKPGKNLLLMNGEDTPHHGAMTELTVWSRVLSEEEIKAWSVCGPVTGEKVVDWTDVALNVSGLEVKEVEQQEICSQLTMSDQFMAFDESKNFHETTKFCVSVGGKLAVARDESSFSEMSSIYNQTCHHNDLTYFYSGYTDIEEHGRWRDFNTGQEMEWENWLESYPTSYTSDDCTYGDITESKVYNADCISKVCPICHLEELKRFQLRGICLDSSVDTYFVMRSNREFLGLLKSRIIFSDEESRWQIVNSSDSTKVLAFMETGETKFPVGRQMWKFLDVNCTDPGKTVRQLNFHVDVPQPGHFCCEDGACIDSQLVCNNFPDCSDRSDERDCSVILFPDYTYNKDYPPVEFRNGEKQSLQLYANLTVLNIFEINEADSSFDFYFMILVQWFDKNLKFEYLKNGKQGNSIPERIQSELWLPHIEFDNTDKIIKSYLPELFITKLADPTLNGDIDQIDVKEIYLGQDNPLTIQIKKRVKFSCSFDNIKNFPFGKQLCTMNFYILGSDNFLTQFIPDQLINFGPDEIGQYVIENWEMKSKLSKGTEERIVEVSMILSRKIGSVFMVTYLPTSK